jgi:hypothetical protein
VFILLTTVLLVAEQVNVQCADENAVNNSTIPKEIIKMRNVLVRALTVAMVLLLTACASTPTWHDMSERDIADWKSIGFDAEAAQNWKSDGFTPEQAGGWSEAKFSREEAKNWAKESFNAEEATNWKQGGFDLDAAKDARKKGLTPVEEEEPAAAPAEAASAEEAPAEDTATE